MAEQVTRKFTNKTDGTPRTGLNLRLVSLTKPSSDPLPFVEVITTVEADKGQYYVAAAGGTTITDVEHGVYQIQRDDGAGYVNFEGMITVEPGRVEGLEAGKFPLSDRVNTAVTHVSAFMGDTEQGTLSVIQRALNYAASTTKHVKVGAWGPAGANVIWTGSPITVPEGVTLDLCGATLYADSATDLPVITFNGDGCLLNGTVQTRYVSGSRVCTQSDAGGTVTFINVTFIRAGTAQPTFATTTNDECLCAFVGCINVVRALGEADGTLTRLQKAIGCNPLYEVGGSLPFKEVEAANISGIEIAEVIKTISTALGTAPSTTPPFGNGGDFTEAVKQMWFDKIPNLESGFSGFSGVIWDWNDSAAPVTPTIEGVYSGSVYDSPVTSLCRIKATVSGSRGARSAKVLIHILAGFQDSVILDQYCDSMNVNISMTGLISALIAGGFSIGSIGSGSKNIDYYAGGAYVSSAGIASALRMCPMHVDSMMHINSSGVTYTGELVSLVTAACKPTMGGADNNRLEFKGILTGKTKMPPAGLSLREPYSSEIQIAFDLPVILNTDSTGNITKDRYADISETSIKFDSATKLYAMGDV